VATDDCDEALVLGVCSSDDEALMNSLMQMHEPVMGHTSPTTHESPRVRTLRR
jgi:hypothetical protein